MQKNETKTEQMVEVWPTRVVPRSLWLRGVSINHSTITFNLLRHGHEKYIMEKQLKNRKANKITKMNKGMGARKTRARVMVVGKSKFQPLHHDLYLVNL